MQTGRKVIPCPPTGPYFETQGTLHCALSGNEHQEKDEPQPQVVVAFGFLMTNCAPSKSSL